MFCSVLQTLLGLLHVGIIDRVQQLFPQLYVMLSSAPCTQGVKIVLIRK